MKKPAARSRRAPALPRKSAPPKPNCLFHRQTECLCIRPVTDAGRLRERLINGIRINEIMSRHAPPDEVERRRALIDAFAARLETECP